MEAEVGEITDAGKGERAPEERENVLNGYHRRDWDTRVGTIPLNIPKLREGSYMPSFIEPRRASEKAFSATIQEAYVNGVSTRSVDRIVQAMGASASGVSKSQVSRLCEEIDARVNEFLSRRLYEDGRRCRYLFLDATYVKGRVGKHVRKRAVVVAIGVDERSWREILGIAVGASESFRFWRRFLRSLKERGLGDPKLAAADSNSALRRAVRKDLPDTDLHLCRVHCMRSVIARIPKDDKKKAGELLKWIFDGKTPEEIRYRWKTAIRELRRRWNCAEVASLTKIRVRNDFLMFARYPKGHWKRISATNLVERLNCGIKRRSRVASIFPNDEAILHRVWAIMMKIHVKWVRGRRYICPNRMDDASSARAALRVPELLAQAA